MICPTCSGENASEDVVCPMCATSLERNAACRAGQAVERPESLDEQIARVQTRLAVLTQWFQSQGLDALAIDDPAYVTSAYSDSSAYTDSASTSAGFAAPGSNTLQPSDASAPARAANNPGCEAAARDHIAPGMAPAAATPAGLAASSRPDQATELEPSIDIGTLRLTLGGIHGAAIESARGHRREAPPADRAPSSFDLPVHNLRTEAAAAVWDALASGLTAVRIDSSRGAGATTLLHILAADSRQHGFAAGPLVLDDVSGPASDIAQRLATPLGVAPKLRLSAAELKQRFSSTAALALFDRAALTADDVNDLREIFPGLRFVIVQASPLALISTIVLGPLRADQVVTLLEAGYGQSLDEDNRRVALDICATVGMLPGRSGLLAVIARAWCRSFISLHVEFDSGDAIIGAFIASRSALEQRILGCMTLSRVPLSAGQIAYLSGSDVHTSLWRLVDRALVRVVDAAYYEVPSYVRHLVPALADGQTAFARLIDALCAGFELSGAAQSEPQLAPAEPALQIAYERAQWGHVIALGQSLADMFAVWGRFGAWGRVLQLLEETASRVSDSAALSLVQHELGVRALLLGDHDEATTYLQVAAGDRKAAGDLAGAAASTALLALADHGAAAIDLASSRAALARRAPAAKALLDGAPTTATLTSRLRPVVASGVPVSFTNLREDDAVKPPHMLAAPDAALEELWDNSYRAAPAAPRKARGRRAVFVALALIILALVGRSLLHRPAVGLGITEFTASPATIMQRSSAQLCVEATAAATVEIFPPGGRLPGAGSHCLAVHPAVTTTYVAVATAADGEQVRHAITVNVQAPQAQRRLSVNTF